MIKTFNTQKEMDSYYKDSIPSGDLAIAKDSRKMLFHTNNVNGENTTYVSEIVGILSPVPDDEIWYVTTNDQKIPSDFITPTAFDASIISHTYENGKGIIKFDAPVTILKTNAIHHYSFVSTIQLPNTIKELQSQSIWFMTNYNDMIVLPHSVKVIGERVFQNWGNVLWAKADKLAIDMSYTQVEEFGTGVFCNGSAIKYIKFPKCTKKINSTGFTFFSAVGYLDTTIDFSLCEQIPVVNGTDLGLTGTGYKIIVPEALYDQWIVADVWKKYADKIVKG